MNLTMWSAIISSMWPFCTSLGSIAVSLVEFSHHYHHWTLVVDFGRPPLIPAPSASTLYISRKGDPFAITAIVVTSLLQYLGCKKPLALIMLDMQQKLVPLVHLLLWSFFQTCSSSFCVVSIQGLFYDFIGIMSVSTRRSLWIRFWFDDKSWMTWECCNFLLLIWWIDLLTRFPPKSKSKFEI